ncbi:TPA: hypothetical protein ACH3X1_001885 [Trebouxia sp. C0004]
MRVIKGILQHRLQLLPSRARTFAALVDDQGTTTGSPKQGNYEKVGVLHEQDMLQRELPESPDVGPARCGPRGRQKHNRGGAHPAQKLCCASLAGGESGP